jgi:hypothetical protein
MAGRPYFDVTTEIRARLLEQNRSELARTRLQQQVMAA